MRAVQSHLTPVKLDALGLIIVVPPVLEEFTAGVRHAGDAEITVSILLVDLFRRCYSVNSKRPKRHLGYQSMNNGCKENEMPLTFTVIRNFVTSLPFKKGRSGFGADRGLGITRPAVTPPLSSHC